MSSASVAVVGVTGVIGREILNLLHQRGVDKSCLDVYASWQSVGLSVPYGCSFLTVNSLDSMCHKRHDVIFWAAGSLLAREFLATLPGRSSSVIIDCSDAWRNHDDVPLVIPEINAASLRDYKGIISSPNCSSTILGVALYPLHVCFRALRVIVSTYQSASGAGLSGMDELLMGMGDYVSGRSVRNRVFEHPLPLNVIPCIGELDEEGNSREELKMRDELRKIFEAPGLLVSCTSVRVPTLRVHALSVSVWFEEKISVAEAYDLWRSAPSIVLYDQVSDYPTPLIVSQDSRIHVGRVRQSAAFQSNGLDFFVAGDQLLKGGALNAVQIAEKMGIIEVAGETGPTKPVDAVSLH
ncbi:aspartate-semialdehyde dehydrogenase [Candidatus Ichthyocystis hellenicum]|uniref:aspartate-semialdehyde dehydrogenase n=1 Tax=Candidatus Ichthyocystis hellenicum TaxID=1561003 RepID=UPI000AE44E8E|nr:aspartate-semialdehyde dehydrogenase [Candidatus Ichthyocystis hellenicum]